jgi:hypothetical protein
MGEADDKDKEGEQRDERHLPPASVAASPLNKNKSCWNGEER